jgi:precorrin-2 dehydrogenase / sirohydrochlorin ferrochelatase
MNIDYPVCLRLAGKSVLVVGAGAVGSARIAGLVDAGANVIVVSMTASSEVTQAARTRRIKLYRRAWTESDLDNISLLVVAINDARVSRRIATLARSRNILTTVADVPELCDFTMPSVGRNGPITIAVSTSGKAPALAGALRRRFEQQIFDDDLKIIDTVADWRGRLPAGPARMRFIKYVVRGSHFITSARRTLQQRLFKQGAL